MYSSVLSLLYAKSRDTCIENRDKSQALSALVAQIFNEAQCMSDLSFCLTSIDVMELHTKIVNLSTRIAPRLLFYCLNNKQNSNRAQQLFIQNMIIKIYVINVYVYNVSYLNLNG